MDYDVIIIGAGPVGSIVAEIAGRQGFNILVIEEHPDIGLPNHCTGKLSINAFKEFQFDYVGILNEVKGATFYSPSGRSFRIERSDTQAYILDREIFDKSLSEKAVKVGVTLITGARAKDFFITDSGVNVIFKYKGKTERVSSRVIVGADGANSTVARRIGLYSKKSSDVRLGVQKEVKGIQNLHPRIVELYFGSKYSPGFFAWIVPTGNESARVGLGLSPNTGRHPYKYLDDFIRNHPFVKKKLRGCSSNKGNAHILPIGGALRQTVYDGVIIVGDAAGQVKSTTGGGLFYGIVCAKIAGETISKALNESGEGILRKNSLAQYQRLWQERLQKEILLSSRIRSFLNTLTDEEMNYLFEIIISNKPLLRKIEAEGNIDWQSKIASRVLNSLIKTIIKRPVILYKMFKSLLI